MLAVRLHQTGGPEVLREEQIPVPDLRPGHALVKIDAVGVNFIEIYQRSGLYPVELPATLRRRRRRNGGGRCAGCRGGCGGRAKAIASRRPA
jgi:hypothetical protein